MLSLFRAFPNRIHRLLRNSAILFTAVTTAASALAESPVFEARFNDDANLDLQTGAAIGPAGSGVSGKPEDKSYAADASNWTEGQKGPAAVLTGDAIPVEGCNELTVTAWYKPRVELRNDTTLVDAAGSVFIWDANKRQWVCRLEAKPAGTDKPPMYWFFTGNTPPLGHWGNPGDWIFIAAVWKKADKKVTFYQGSRSAAAASAKESVRPEDVEPLKERKEIKRTIGNTAGTKKDRPLDGNIDNVRFFSKALDSAAIESIRQADVKNEPVTLP
jgi:hypothetical protein